MLLLAHSDEDAGARSGESARTDLLAALDVDELWQACLALVTTRLACHSCSLLFDIEGLQPRSGLHYLAAPAPQPVTSLTVAAPFLELNPRVRVYSFSQIASQDRHADARLHAQDPAPQWRDFIHMAFWHDSGLDAVLSIRLSTAQPAPAAEELGFITELHPLVDAALRRIRRLRTERRRQRALEAQLQAGATMPADLPSRLSSSCEVLRRPCSCGRMPATDARQRRRVPARQDAETRLPGCAAAHAADTPASLQLLQLLSPSERKVATMVGSGMRNAAIAEQLCRSPKTIENQISAIYRKLDIENRTQLARLLA